MGSSGGPWGPLVGYRELLGAMVGCGVLGPVVGCGGLWEPVVGCGHLRWSVSEMMWISFFWRKSSSPLKAVLWLMQHQRGLCDREVLHLR